MQASLQARRQVPETETAEWSADSARERHHLESLAHLSGQQQRRGDLAVRSADGFGGAVDEAREFLLDAVLEQEMRLGREARGLETRRARVVRERGEIDPGRQVPCAGFGQHVVDPPVAPEGAERAAVAGRVIELRARQSVVDDEEQAALQRGRGPRDPLALAGPDLGNIAGGQARRQRLLQGFDRMGEHWFKKHDTNSDGKVTLDEAKAKALAHFDAMDANRDGTLTPEERRAGHKKMREEWKAKRG